MQFTKSFKLTTLFVFIIGLTLAGPVVKLDKKVQDFGDITEGEVVSTVFMVENTGDEPLIINDVVAPCGCTIPEFTQSPILPGQKGEIKVTFKSEGKVGIQRKAVRIVSNAPTPTVFQIVVNVIPKE